MDFPRLQNIIDRHLSRATNAEIAEAMVKLLPDGIEPDQYEDFLNLADVLDQIPRIGAKLFEEKKQASTRAVVL